MIYLGMINKKFLICCAFLCLFLKLELEVKATCCKEAAR